MKKILSFIVLNLFAIAPLLAQSNEGKLLFERGYATAWTNDDVQKWGVPTKDPENIGTDLVEGYGLHCGPFDMKSYIRLPAVASDTISTNDVTRGVLDIDAQWVSYGSLGRAWFEEDPSQLLNFSYFRVGNVYLMQNAQSKNMAYSTDGLATYTVFDIPGMTGQNSTTKLDNIWAGRDTVTNCIANIPFIVIKMQIDMPHNKLNFMRLSSATKPDSILYEINDVDIVADDWKNVILESGFHKVKSINGSPNEFLKAIKVVESSLEGERATYTVKYMLDGKQVNPVEEKQGFVGETVKIPEILWVTDAESGAKTKYFVKEVKDAVITKTNNEGVDVFSYEVRKANEYTCKVTSSTGAVLVNNTIIEGEESPYVYWNKFIKNEEDGCWYETQAPYGFQPSCYVDTSVVVTYTKSDISYFYDTADMYVKMSHSGVTPPVMVSTSYSGGTTQRHLVYDPVWYAKEIIPDGGVFEVQIPWINAHTADSYIELDTYKDSIVVDSLVYEVGRIDKDYYSYNSGTEFKVDARRMGVADIKGFEVPVNSGVILQYFGSDNSNACLDYVALKWLDYLKETVDMTGEMVNYRTGQKREVETSLKPFVCDKNYIFSKSSDVMAYYLKDIKLSTQKNSSTGADEKVLVAEFDTIVGAVPVGTVCVISGNAGASARIPYVNHSEFSYTPATENVNGATWTKQLSVTQDGAGVSASSSKAYCLEMVDGTAKFVEVAKPQSVPDGVVYYTIPTQVIEDNNISASNVICTFAGNDTTSGINEVLCESYEGATYNLNGQRVKAGVKGIVVKNGRKYIVK